MRIKVGNVSHVVSVMFKPANHGKFPRTRSSSGDGEVTIEALKSAEVMGEEISCANARQRVLLRTASVGAIKRDLCCLCVAAGLITVKRAANVTFSRCGVPSRPWIVGLVS